MCASLFPFLSSIPILLFLFLLLKLVLFKDLPKFAKLGLVFECSPSYFFQVAPAGHGPFVVGAQLGVQDDFCNLDVSQSFLASPEHEEAACEVIEDACCLNVFQPED